MSGSFYAAYRPDGFIWRVRHLIESDVLDAHGPMLKCDHHPDINAEYVDLSGAAPVLLARPPAATVAAKVKAGRVIYLPGAEVWFDGEPQEDFDGVLEFAEPGVYRLMIRHMPAQDAHVVVTVTP